MFDDLSELIVLEQFKNSVLGSIVQHINDLKVRSVTEATSLADDYVLTRNALMDVLESVPRRLWGDMWVARVRLTLKNVTGGVLRKHAVVIRAFQS